MTCGSLPSRIAWHSDVGSGRLMPSRKSSGRGDSTTSRCCVSPSNRLRKAMLRPSAFFAVTSRLATWSATSDLGFLTPGASVARRPA
jgi:hypothetical protein